MALKEVPPAIQLTAQAWIVRELYAPMHCTSNGPISYPYPMHCTSMPRHPHTMHASTELLIPQ